MKQKLLSILQYIIFLGGGLFLVWWQLRGMTAEDKKEFYNALNNANYWLMVPVVIMSLLSHLSRAMRWKLLLEPLGYNPAIKNMFAVTMLGYLANAAVPRLGEVLKCTFLARYEKLKVDKLVGTILVERAFDVICYVILTGLTLLLQAGLIGGAIKEHISSMGNAAPLQWWVKLLLAAVVLAIGFCIFIFVKYPQHRLVIKAKNILKGLGQGFASIKNLKKRKQFVAHTVFIWAMYLLQIYIAFNAIDGTMHLGIKAAFSVLTLATLAMIATPGGIGTFPIFVMQTLALYGIAAPTGKAFGWLMWGATTSIAIAVGLLCLLLLPYINKNKNETGKLHTS
jgi:glycosyltransferase 2 family protein